MSQPKRTETLERFKNGEIRLLVCSDVAARGLDIQGLSHVFNFDVPYHAEDYVHRIGRTGRAGRQGRAFTLATPEDGKLVAAIEKLIGKPIPVAAVPDMAPAEFDATEDRSRRRRGRTRAEPRSAPRETRDDRRPPTRDRKERDRAAAPEAHAERDNVTPFKRPANRPAPPRRREPAPADEPRIVGFGDHLPAFLARPPKKIAARA
jgi:superfamily II DNA/RNA helicase